MNGRDPVASAALLDATRTVSMILTAVDELANVLAVSQVEGTAVYPFSCNVAFAMLAQYAQSKLDDVEVFFARSVDATREISRDEVIVV
ncbi:hypothetical protein [Paraburkholderia megapolitana]|uniref:hypothetical protein n=1 Tax=Paraburkholderia megapolitana TaxID=420953 RepID=UPI0038B97BDA